MPDNSLGHTLSALPSPYSFLHDQNHSHYAFTHLLFTLHTTFYKISYYHTPYSILNHKHVPPKIHSHSLPSLFLSITPPKYTSLLTASIYSHCNQTPLFFQHLYFWQHPHPTCFIHTPPQNHSSPYLTCSDFR